MARKIVLRKRYIKNLDMLLSYLNENWGDMVSHNVIHEIDNRILTLASQPNIGLRSEKMIGARSILITKHNRLIYKIKANNLIIIDLRDTRMNPKRNKY